MCQMCEEYEAELKRLGVVMDGASVAGRHQTSEEPGPARAVAAITPKGPEPTDSEPPSLTITTTDSDRCSTSPA